jgi:hypothetical protein
VGWLERAAETLPDRRTQQRCDHPSGNVTRQVPGRRPSPGHRERVESLRPADQYSRAL